MFINTQNLILASSSPYRKELLQRLQLPFRCISPEIDESVQAGETPVELVKRLAITKANKIAATDDGALIIASDQVLIIEKTILGKPGNFDNAKRQLNLIQGKTVTFFTSVCLLNSASSNIQMDVAQVDVSFRALSVIEIERYLLAEQPYDCAGSFKSEGQGITLLTKIETDDPTALIGLPLIRLSDMLRNEQVLLP